MRVMMSSSSSSSNSNTFYHTTIFEGRNYCLSISKYIIFILLFVMVEIEIVVVILTSIIQLQHTSCGVQIRQRGWYISWQSISFRSSNNRPKVSLFTEWKDDDITYLHNLLLYLYYCCCCCCYCCCYGWEGKGSSPVVIDDDVKGVE